MANSVSLSTDMTKLIFTNGAGTTEIDLGGDGALLYLKADDEIHAEAADEPLSGSGVVESINNSQWTLTYNEAEQISFFIGIIDVDAGKEEKKHDLEMNGNQVNIRKSGTNLTVVSAPV